MATKLDLHVIKKIKKKNKNNKGGEKPKQVVNFSSPSRGEVFFPVKYIFSFFLKFVSKQRER